ncbi:Tyrosine recombinase XerC [compost metagenome]
MTDWLTLAQAAAQVGCSTRLLQKRCLDGTIPALKVGNQYRIRPADLEGWTRFTPLQQSAAANGKLEMQQLYSQIDRWLDYLRITGKAPTTVANYHAYLKGYLRRVADSGHGVRSVSHLYQRQTLVAGFSALASKSHSLKLNSVIALTSFGQFLVAEGILLPDALQRVREMRPKRGPEPRRTSLKPADVPRLFHAISVRTKDDLENLTVAAMVGCMVYAGMRVSEVCGLRLKDVMLEEATLVVRHGKGRRDRKLGVRQELADLLKRYVGIRPRMTSATGKTLGIRGDERFFVGPLGTDWNKDKLAKRMQHLSRLIELDITCHGLRRTFATAASAQGRSTNFIRIALGHQHLATTQTYLRTTEEEVAEAMRGW